MATAWDPVTGRSIEASGLADLLAAADARAGNISEMPQIGETIMQRDHFRAPPTSREDLEHALKIAMAEWKSSYDEESAVKARKRVVAARAALRALIAPIVPVSGGN